VVFTIDQGECASLRVRRFRRRFRLLLPLQDNFGSLSSNCTVVMLRIESARNVDQDLTAL
jgi:hypothetical protein